MKTNFSQFSYAIFDFLNILQYLKINIFQTNQSLNFSFYYDYFYNFSSSFSYPKYLQRGQSLQEIFIDGNVSAGLHF